MQKNIVIMKISVYLSALILTFFACHVQAKRVIRYPLFESTQTPAFKIDSICLDNKDTFNERRTSIL